MRQIEPVARPLFAVVRAGQQAIHLAGVGAGTLIGEEFGGLLGSGGRPVISRDTRLNKRGAVSLGRRRDVLLREPRER